jgi:HAMP domain-containing protein
MGKYWSWLGRITPKLISLLIVSLLILGALFWKSFNDSANMHLKQESELNLNRLDLVYNTIFEKAVDALSISIDLIAENKELTDRYLEADRAGYILLAQPLFDTLKNDLNITHYAVISMNETSFVKLHKIESYGESISLGTLDIARETMDMGVGIQQCPQKGFTLSVVKPFFNGSTHIGFIELRIKMEYILKETAALLDENLVMTINKNYIDQAKWAQFKNFTGETNNWDDMDSNLIVHSTVDQPETYSVIGFSDEDLTLSDENTLIDLKYIHNGTYYSSGRVPIYNASGQIMGSIILIDDITEHHVASALEFDQTMVQTYVTLLVVIVCIYVFIHLQVSRPIVEIIAKTKKFGKGDVDVQFKTKVNGEIGELAQAFSEMADELKAHRVGLEDTIARRTRELNSKVDDLEQYKKSTVNRELRMIELKDEIEALKRKISEAGP